MPGCAFDGELDFSMEKGVSLSKIEVILFAPLWEARARKGLIAAAGGGNKLLPAGQPASQLVGRPVGRLVGRSVGRLLYRAPGPGGESIYFFSPPPFWSVEITLAAARKKKMLACCAISDSKPH